MKTYTYMKDTRLTKGVYFTATLVQEHTSNFDIFCDFYKYNLLKSGRNA